MDRQDLVQQYVKLDDHSALTLNVANKGAI
jgi:hypothetical protein